MALAIVMIDIIAGLFMALNFDIAYRIPLIGPLLADLTKKTKQFLSDHRWFASLWFFAILLMEMVPFFGSGGIRGSVAGNSLAPVRRSPSLPSFQDRLPGVLASRSAPVLPLPGSARTGHSLPGSLRGYAGPEPASSPDLRDRCRPYSA